MGTQYLSLSNNSTEITSNETSDAFIDSDIFQLLSQTENEDKNNTVVSVEPVVKLNHDSDLTKTVNKIEKLPHLVQNLKS